MTRWLVSGIGIAGGVMVAAGKPAALGPLLVTVGVLSGLPLLLITMLVVVAVFSSHRARRGAAEKILNQLFKVLSRPRQQ